MAQNDRVGEAYINILPKGDKFDAGVQSIIRKVESSAQFKVGADTTQATQAVNQLGAQIQEQAGNTWQSAAMQVAGYTAAVYGIKAVVEGAMNKLSGLFDQLAKAQAGFTAILHSESAGKNLLDDIREFARVSPFVTQELVNYSQQLLGVGQSAETIVPLLKNVGDLVSSVGGDTQNIGRVLFTLTQIRSIGRLAGQDAMQLQSALIPITKLLSEYLGKTTAQVKKMQEAGTISADTVFAAISAAGLKVEGAMDSATKNISGARAVLQDTITIMFQNQPVLNKIFEDTYKGILALSNFIGSDEFQKAFNDMFEEVNRVYEAVKPFFESLSVFAKQSTFGGLKLFTSLLSTLGTVLEAIPPEAMEMLAKMIGVLITIRAPLMLFKYVTAIKDMTTGLIGAPKAIGAATMAMTAQGNAAEKAATQVNMLNNSVGEASKTSILKKIAGTNVSPLIAGLGLGAVGAAVSDGKGGERDAVGNVATFAAMGAAFGPAGIVVGGAVGAITSITSAIRKAKEELAKIQDLAADAYQRGFFGDLASKYGGDMKDPRAIRDYFNEIHNGEAIMTRLEVARRKAAKAMDISDVQAYTDALAQEQKYQDALLNDPKYKEFFDGVRMKAEQVNAINTDLIPQKTLNRGQKDKMTEIFRGSIGPTTNAEWEKFTQKWNEFGVSLDYIESHSAEEISAYIDAFQALPDIWKDATKEAVAYNDAIDKGKKAATEAYAPFITQAKNAGASMQSAAEIKATLDSLRVFNSVTEQIEIDPNAKTAAGVSKIGQGLQAAAIQEYTDAIARGVPDVEAMAQSNSYLAAQFDLVQETLKLTDAQFQALLETAGLWQQYQAVDQDSFIGNFEEAATQLGLSKTALMEILQLQGEIDPNMVISVSVEAEEALKTLKGMQDRQGYLTQDQLKLKQEAEAGITAAGTEKAKKDQDAFKAKQLEDFYTEMAKQQKQREDDDKKRWNEAEAEAKRRAAEAEQWANTVESVTERLSSAVENAAKAIQQAAESWLGSVKDRTQYEAGTSVSRLTKNARSQANDAMEIQAGIESLKSRGVTDSMLSALGIDNINDLKQVRKLLKSNDLGSLTSALSDREAASQSLALSVEEQRQKAVIVDAIKEAAKDLGVEPSAAQSQKLADSININANMDPAAAIAMIMSALTAGKV